MANGSGKVAVSSVTSTELGYPSGVTSALQTQLDARRLRRTATTPRPLRAESSTLPACPTLARACRWSRPAQSPICPVASNRRSFRGGRHHDRRPPLGLHRQRVENVGGKLHRVGGRNARLVGHRKPAHESDRDRRSRGSERRPTAVLGRFGRRFIAYLTPGTGLAISGTTIAIAGVGIQSSQYYAARYAASVSINWNNGNTQAITLANDGNTLTMSNPVAGALLAEIPAAGQRFGRNDHWAGEREMVGRAEPTLTATNGRTDIVALYYNGTNYAASAALDFAL